MIKGDSKKTLLHESVMKADSSNDVQYSKEAELSGIDEVIPPPYPIAELQRVLEKSTILQQCIDAYRRNIVGFGASPQYIEDDVVEDETPEMIQEWETVKSFIKHFNFDESFEDVVGSIIADRETTGNGYLEIIRDGQGLPSEGHRLDPAYIYITKLSDWVEVEQTIDGKVIKRKRRFRRYVQDIGTKKVWYKEFGDPRKMDCRTGEYVENIDEKFEANEIIHFKLGSQTYGVPRWIGQLVHMFGARMAEELNYKYFTQGRHTPMAILLHNAELSPESEQALQEYAKSVEGVENSHKFLIIEAEGLEEGILEDERTPAKVELKSLADMLQQDALFLDYDDKSREKVQSAFRLPDIYVGRSKDYNRATADTARTITEEQVFEPERKSLEWVFNHRFLPYYGITKTKMVFNKPEISNVEEIVKVINAGVSVKALAPNDVRDILGKLLGKELDLLEGEMFDVPAGSLQAEAQIEGMRANNEQNKENAQQSQNNSRKGQANNREDDEEVGEELVKKAYEGDELINILKDVRDVLEELNYNGKNR